MKTRETGFMSAVSLGAIRLQPCAWPRSHISARYGMLHRTTHHPIRLHWAVPVTAVTRYLQPFQIKSSLTCGFTPPNTLTTPQELLQQEDRWVEAVCFECFRVWVEVCVCLIVSKTRGREGWCLAKMLLKHSRKENNLVTAFTAGDSNRRRLHWPLTVWTKGDLSVSCKQR